MRITSKGVGIVAIVTVTLWVLSQMVSFRPSSYDWMPSAIKDLEMPEIHVEYQKPTFNESKVALIIENRASGLLAPLLLHMMSVLPPDWRFRFMGSNESVQYVNESAAIQRQVGIGKLDLTYIPPNVSVAGQEPTNRLFTNLWFYQTLLAPAEHLLVFQTDSIMCSKSLDSIDNWLEWDWVGASWGEEYRWSGNGGLSLRRVSSIIKVLQHQERQNDTEAEDIWLAERLAYLPGAKVTTGHQARSFSVEGQWYEWPLGYHTGGSGSILSTGTWGKLELRRKVFGYCPEVKMHLDLDHEEFGTFCPVEW